MAKLDMNTTISLVSVGIGLAAIVAVLVFSEDTRPYDCNLSDHMSVLQTCVEKE